MANDTITGTQIPGPALPTIEGGRSAVAATNAQLSAAVDHTLARFLTTETAALAAVDPALGAFASTTFDFVLAGGKRLRPTFAYWGWRGLAGAHRPAEPVLPALAALELMHTFALLHDDVMDASATRRGQPAAHRVFAEQHVRAARRGDAGRFGEAAAVLLGDLCLVWADQLMASTALPAADLLTARRFYDQMRVEAIAGQYLDILGEAEPHTWSVDRALCVARHKTASYTVLRPLHFGAALADGNRADPDGNRADPDGNRADPDGGGPAAVATAYTRYGVAVGEAFQLRDDLLGVYGDPAVTGKPAGDDLRTGKPTTLLLLARQLADPAQRAELDRGPAGAVNPADGPGAHDPGLAHLADVVRDTGAVARVEEMIQQRVAEALDALDGAPIDGDAGRALADLALAATHRRA